MALIAFSATVLAAIFLVPQIVRLLVHGDTRGVSATWAAFGLITNLAWVDYLWQQGRWAPVAAPAIALVTYGITLVVIARLDRGHRWMRTAIVYTVSMALASRGGLIAMGLVLAVTPVIQVAPELLAVFKERHPSGVSPATWALAGAEAVLWGIYGWLAGDLALVGYGVFSTAAATFIIGRWVATHPMRTRVRTAF
jgi:uncharacterized protein with PQ loop repeat